MVDTWIGRIAHAVSLRGNRPGAVLAVLAVSAVGLLAVTSLAIDIGMMYSARNEAQRVADAAALAGASAYCDNAPAQAMTRAQEFVDANYVLSQQLNSGSEANIELQPATGRVRVTIRRQNIPTWFARIFGVTTVNIAASATAECGLASSVECVRPWAVQDMWLEAGGNIPGPGDYFDPAEDTYIPVDPYNPSAFATGYGSAVRGGDFGTPISIKTPTPGSNELSQPGPGVFMILDFPDHPDLSNCGRNPGGQLVTGSGANGIYTNSICGCNRNPVSVGEPIPVNYGNRVGPTENGMRGLIAQDPSATWTANGPSNPNSPRIVPVAFIPPLGRATGSPPHWNASTLPNVTVSNIALMFIEGYSTHGNHIEIVGRFMTYAQGQGGANPAAGARYLRLIE